MCVCVCVRTHAQSCPMLCDPMDCNLPGSSVHGIFSGKKTGVGCHFLPQRIFPTQGLNPPSLASPVLAGEFFVTAPLGKTIMDYYSYFKKKEILQY